MSLSIHVVCTVILSLITIASCIVISQVVSGFYCEKTGDQTTGTAKAGTAESTQAVDPIHPFFKHTTSATCAVFGILCVCATLDRLCVLMELDDSHFLMLITLPLYYVGRILLSLIFIGRLYFTFRGTIFAYSNYTMNSLKAAWLTMVLSAVIASVCVSPKTVIYGMTFGTLLIFIDIVLSFVLLYLYAKKLHSVICAHDEVFMEIMTKYAWLYTVCFASTWTLFLIFTFIIFQFILSGGAIFDIHDVILFVAIDSLCNMICLWLNWRFSHDFYQLFCGVCDRQCAVCCRACAKDAIQQKMLQSQSVMSGVESNSCKVRGEKVEKVETMTSTTIEIVPSNSKK